jgi:hypothetical protein
MNQETEKAARAHKGCRAIQEDYGPEFNATKKFAHLDIYMNYFIS